MAHTHHYFLLPALRLSLGDIVLMKSYIPYLIYVHIPTYVYVQKAWLFFEVVNYKTNLLQALVQPTSSSTLLIHCLVRFVPFSSIYFIEVFWVVFGIYRVMQAILKMCV